MKTKGIAVSLIVLFSACLCVVRADGGALTRAPDPYRFTEARWIWTEPKSNPPTNAYFRIVFDVTKKVKRAWLHSIMENNRGFWVNGRKVEFKQLKENLKLGGTIHAVGAEIGDMLVEGRNVVAFERFRTLTKISFGAIVHGGVEYTDGTTYYFHSSAKETKASGVLSEGWKESGFDDSAWLAAYEHGGADMVPWARHSDIVKQMSSPEEYAKYRDFMEHGGGAFPAAKLAAEPESPNAKIVYRGLLPGIETNGKTFPPYTMMECEMVPDAASESIIRKCAAMGLHLYGVQRFNRLKYQRPDGTWNFDSFGPGLCRILQLDPEARFVISYQNANQRLAKGWAKKYPDELVGYARKTKLKHEYAGNAVAPSLASEVYRKEERAFWKAFGEYVRNQPWRRRLIMVHCAVGGSGDGMPCGCHCMPDTGKRMTEKFRVALKAKYKTDDALRKAWADETVTLETATVPDEKQRHGSGRFMKDPADPRDVRVSDYYECYHSVLEDFSIDMGRAIKKALPGVLAGAYYGEVILGYTPEGTPTKFDRIMSTRALDYFYSTVRDYNLTDGLYRVLVPPMRDAGMFASVEGDVRVHTGLDHGEMQWRCKTPEESRSTVGKFVCNSLIWGTGWQVLDFGLNRRVRWFDCPEALEPLAAGIKAWKRHYAAGDTALAADIAVVIDPDMMWRNGYPLFPKNLKEHTKRVSSPIQTLGFSGYAYDLHSPGSLAKSGRKYKKVINIGFEDPLLPHDSKEWAKILDDAGCHRFTDTGFAVRRNNRFLMVFSPLNASIRTSDKELLGKMFTTTGRTEVKLERRYKTIRDVMTGEVLGKDTDSLVLSSTGPRIWLLETID